jgi:hypothetical protein
VEGGLLVTGMVCGELRVVSRPWLASSCCSVSVIEAASTDQRDVRALQKL